MPHTNRLISQRPVPSFTRLRPRSNHVGVWLVRSNHRFEVLAIFIVQHPEGTLLHCLHSQIRAILKKNPDMPILILTLNLLERRNRVDLIFQRSIIFVVFHQACLIKDNCTIKPNYILDCFSEFFNCHIYTSAHIDVR